MTDRKQEAIKTLAEGLREALTKGSHYESYHFANEAEALYDRLLPLIRGEFPGEERLRKILSSMMNKVSNSFRGSGYITSKDQERIISEIIADANKKPCQKCGGSGRIGNDNRRDGISTISCSQCGGTVDCQHEKIVNWYSMKGVCLNCKRVIYDRRNGEERRTILVRTVSIDSESVFIHPINGAPWVDRRILKGRRK